MCQVGFAVCQVACAVCQVGFDIYTFYKTKTFYINRWGVRCARWFVRCARWVVRCARWFVRCARWVVRCARWVVRCARWAVRCARKTGGATSPKNRFLRVSPRPAGCQRPGTTHASGTGVTTRPSRDVHESGASSNDTTWSLAKPSNDTASGRLSEHDWTNLWWNFYPPDAQRQPGARR